MSMNYASAAPTQRSTSFFIEDILLHKPKPLREVIPSPFCNSLASRMPILEYGYPLMPTPILAPHPHHPLHKPEHHQYFFTSGKQEQKNTSPCISRDAQNGIIGYILLNNVATVHFRGYVLPCIYFMVGYISFIAFVS